MGASLYPHARLGASPLIFQPISCDLPPAPQPSEAHKAAFLHVAAPTPMLPCFRDPSTAEDNMDDPPGTIPQQRQAPHPRRPPAHQSVSLRHSPPANGVPPKAPTFYNPQATTVSSPNVGASDKANPPSSVSPQVKSNKNSSGESSDAGKWFENTNNAVQSNNNLDNDPPFFLRNSSSSETPPDGHAYDHLYQQTTASMPYRPGMANVSSESVEDFRSVIDDLTVANKRLKQKLRKYEKLHDSHLQDEKLFEVRFHGLPDHKKRELEETLRKFAADMDSKSEQGYPAISSHPAMFENQKTASSHASRFAESGYASMSGHNSNSTRSNQPSNHASNADWDQRRLTKMNYNQQQQTIQSYLHDIPRGLLPKGHHAPMSDKSKKKLVVRRLEQIFAGKRSAPGNHPQPMQQEEVAQSAATADRRAKEAAGQRSKTEGHREARIMPVRADEENVSGHQEALPKIRPNLQISEQYFAGAASPDQRPTRPLDLDIYRAQVPSDNMNYIRHLGFTPPNMMSEGSPEDDHGWIYLNLLINMAQLHTLNVTPDFVKDAVTEYSSLFELSHDGRKIRWRGHPDVTLSSTGSSSEYQGNSPSEGFGNSKSPHTSAKTGGSASSGPSMNPERVAQRLARKQKEKERNQFSYTPLFFHKDDSDDEEDSYGLDTNSSSNSPYQVQQAGDSSGLGSSAMQSSSSKRRRNDGPIIFYSKAKFCTDLTGDSRGIASHTSDSYQNITSHPIGAPTTYAGRLTQSSNIMERRGPLETTMMDIDSKDGNQTASSSEELSFSPDALNDDNGTESPEAVDFEASGLGGVHPEDNFSIRVRRSQQQTVPASAIAARRRSLLYPKKILDVLNNDATREDNSTSKQQQNVIKEEILSASRKTLPNSALPPASFLPFDSTSSGDVDSDLESDVSSSLSSTSSSENIPATALHLLNISPAHRDFSNASRDSFSEEDDEDDSDDGSIDLLATARRMDPHTVIASEREYDASLADRLAEEIPAGSSAATAGGGSGFNTPANALETLINHGESTGRRSRQKRQSTTSGSLSSQARAKLKRNRTRESIATALQETSKRARTQKRE
ncbi:hypothetical protein PMIN06_008762 [Paraphaeosphaeria minitans]|uniref:Frequency clock protein n=1 Tax=Paraphaeosphaeria minitans TaxID=565426 RepID=A0A9P6GDZ3_9PLEO|nr:hypothetical protein PMIN01_08973 [Paraphaeosphaeria minitans]